MKLKMFFLHVQLPSAFSEGNIVWTMDFEVLSTKAQTSNYMVNCRHWSSKQINGVFKLEVEETLFISL